MGELRKLFNVRRGDMSLVGPRPEVGRYVELFRHDYEHILRVRPGITDLASLKYRDEEAILSRAAVPEEEYVAHILPDKIRLAKDYVRHSAFLFDLSVLIKTALKLFGFNVSTEPLEQPAPA